MTKPGKIANHLAALETYEQALTFLNAEISTGDEYIHTLYTTKVIPRLKLCLQD
jgi:hypothetical protein